MDREIEKSYEELRMGIQRVKVSNDGTFTCPYCPNKKNRHFLYWGLLQHASSLGKNTSGKRSEMEQSNHLALLKYVEKDLANVGTGGPSKPVVTEFDYDLFVNFAQVDDKVVWPLTGIMVNLPNRLVEGDRSKLRGELLRRGFNFSCIHYLWDDLGFTGLVEFEQDWTGLCNAMLFERTYEEDHHGKKDWYSMTDQKSGLYAWIARDDDYCSSNILGAYLRSIGFLKCIPEIMEEELRNQDKHVLELTNMIEEKNKHLKEMAGKFKDEIVSLCDSIEKKEQLLRSYHDATRAYFKRCFGDQEKVNSQFESYKRELLVRQMELEKPEAEYASEIFKMDAIFRGEAGEVKKLEVLNQALTTKEHESSDELEEARMELINVLLKGMSCDAVIGVKNTNGKFDSKTCFEAIKRRPFYIDTINCESSDTIYNEDDEEDKAEYNEKVLFSLCLKYFLDEGWHPFRVSTVENKQKEVIDHGDKKLISLKEKFGVEAYNKVTTALAEMNEQSGHFMAPELWNFKEGRKATLKEAVECVIKQTQQ